MNLNLTSKEMEIILSLTANGAIIGDEHNSLWRKVSAEFVRLHKGVQAIESLRNSHKVGA